MSHQIGDRFKLLVDQFDRDENDQGRITPAGCVAAITAIYADVANCYQLECDSTGGWWCVSTDELKKEFRKMGPR